MQRWPNFSPAEIACRGSGKVLVDPVALDRLQLLRDAHAPQLNEEGRRLLDHAIFTTFVDCRELGAESLAAAMLSPVGGPPGAPGGEAETEAGSGASDA